MKSKKIIKLLRIIELILLIIIFIMVLLIAVVLCMHLIPKFNMWIWRDHGTVGEWVSGLSTPLDLIIAYVSLIRTNQQTKETLGEMKKEKYYSLINRNIYNMWYC